jgi:hypothetical protein
MLLETLIILSLVSICIVVFFPKLDTPVAWVLGFIVAFLAGTRSGGFDFEEYEIIIHGVRSVDDLFVALALAKDPFFYLIIKLVEYFSDDSMWIYLLVALISMGTKVYATKIISGRRVFFISTYTVFLSTGFEFAAIRAGMAIGCLLIGFVVISKWRWFWSLAAIFSHLSTMVPLIGKIFLNQSKFIFSITPFLLLSIYLMPNFIEDTKLYEHYGDNFGRIMAFIWPFGTAVAYFGLLLSGNYIKEKSSIVGKDSIFASLICILFGFILDFSLISHGIFLIKCVV